MPDFPLSPPRREPVEHSEHAVFRRVTPLMGNRPMFVENNPKPRERKPGLTGTNEDVIEAFLGGERKHSRASHVPGGRRMRSEPSGDEPGAHDLFSYQTVIARRHKEGDISLTPRRYSTTTSKAHGKLQRRMIEQGYEESGETRKVRAKVPGRWGGFGPAWHATGWEDLPFVHFRKKA